jgi:uncharacterized protein YifN (PemK superfamily)
MINLVVKPRRGVLHYISHVMKSIKWLRISMLSSVSGKRLARILNTDGETRDWLPYWKHLDIRHSIDVMHIEKNVCESLLGTPQP